MHQLCLAPALAVACSTLFADAAGATGATGAAPGVGAAGQARPDFDRPAPWAAPLDHNDRPRP